MAQGSLELLAALALIDPRQPYGTELFDALIRLGVTPSIEAVCLRLNSERQIEVYLTRRAEDDTAYPGMYHCPGTVRRPHETIGMGFERLSKKEFGVPLLSYRFVGEVDHPDEARAHLVSQVYLCIPQDGPGKGQWFPVVGLPQPMVETHEKRIIPAALGVFVAGNTEYCW